MGMNKITPIGFNLINSFRINSWGILDLRADPPVCFCPTSPLHNRTGPSESAWSLIVLTAVISGYRHGPPMYPRNAWGNNNNRGGGWNGPRGGGGGHLGAVGPAGSRGGSGINGGGGGGGRRNQEY